MLVHPSTVFRSGMFLPLRSRWWSKTIFLPAVKVQSGRSFTWKEVIVPSAMKSHALPPASMVVQRSSRAGTSFCGLPSTTRVVLGMVMAISMPRASNSSFSHLMKHPSLRVGLRGSEGALKTSLKSLDGSLMTKLLSKASTPSSGKKRSGEMHRRGAPKTSTFWSSKMSLLGSVMAPMRFITALDGENVMLPICRLKSLGRYFLISSGASKGK